MGSYPSANLHYGIDVGEWEWEADEEELTWWNPETENEHGDPCEAANDVLKAAGLRGVTLEPYGDLCRSYTLYILSARSIVFLAYDSQVVSQEHLVVDPVEAENLVKAWALLFGPLEHAEPAWVGTVSYG